ncbi:MAG: ComEA family DNA-binding protein [bacterium]
MRRMKERVEKALAFLREHYLGCIAGATALILTFTLGYFVGVYNRGHNIIITSLPEAETPEIKVTPLPESMQEVEYPINLNTADLLTLTHIPGVGESTAKKIIAWREENGGFRVIEEIMLVSGIGEKKFAAMKEYITVTGAAAEEEETYEDTGR